MTGPGLTGADRQPFPGRATGSEFAGLVAPYRRELIVHCYRFLGSPFDAEDAVQETLLRAYRRRGTFVRDVSFRAWLYKIATNICLDALDRRRRTLPTIAYPPTDPAAALPGPVTDPVWVEPLPGGLPSAAASAPGPAARVEARESITLAFVAALQHLTPRQRATLLLRDVLDYSAREAAETLGMTLPAVNSALYRARRALREHYRPAADQGEVDDALLGRYVRAWEAADIDGLIALLQEEAVLAMPPWPVWFRGQAAIRAALQRDIFAGWTPGQERLRRVTANGRPAVALYRRGAAGDAHRPLGIQLLGAGRDDRLAVITVYLNPNLFPAFGLPDSWPDAAS